MSRFEYTTIDRVISKFYRDTKDTSITELDLIEWIGEAMGHLRVAELDQQSIAFIEVKNYEAELPKGFKMVLQIARNNSWTSSNENTSNLSPQETLEQLLEGTVPYEEHPLLQHPINQLGYPIPLDADGLPITDYDVAYYRPYYDLQWEYSPWVSSQYYKQNYTPVRLADNTFFNSVVCREKDIPYNSCPDEYTIVGTEYRKLRFSFKEGYIALAYLKNAIDSQTGYPLIPDDESFLSAITYYIKWKIAEYHQWNGRRGFDSIVEVSHRNWNHYCKQSRNKAKMPQTLDDYQDLLEQSHYMIPRHNRYYGFFGNLNSPESRKFNDPSGKNRGY